MWIDAICINQNDISERNNQVRQMGAIYSQASQVVVWLGEETGDSGRAIAFLEKIGNGSIPSLNVINFALSRIGKHSKDSTRQITGTNNGLYKKYCYPVEFSCNKANILWIGQTSLKFLLS